MYSDPVDGFDVKVPDTVRIRVLIEYETRMRAAGLWWTSTDQFPKPADLTRRMEQKLVIENDLESAFGPFPLFFFDKAETEMHADRLADDLVQRYSQSHELSYVDVMRLVWSRPSHDRDMPAFALRLLNENVMTPAGARELIIGAWQSTEFPERNGGTGAWVAAFRRAGYVTDEQHPTRPQPPLTLWRAAPAHTGGMGMAWSAQQNTARHFLARSGDDPGLFTVTLDADTVQHAILAHLVGRNEDEYVCDPDSLPRPERTNAERRELG